MRALALAMDWRQLPYCPQLVARARETRPANSPEWITVSDATEIFGMSHFFFYDHWKELPFCRKIGRSVKLNSRDSDSRL